MEKIKVLIVDDSALVRGILAQILSSDPMIEVVDTAMDPIFAVKKIKKHNPDVITLDIEMPRMDGISFLTQLMKSNPIPTIMISSLTQRTAEISLKALAIGAFDVFPKPNNLQDFNQNAEDIKSLVKAAAKSKVKHKLKEIFTSQTSDINNYSPPTQTVRSGNINLIAVGASTGGTVAFENLIKGLPTSIPGIVLIQHMPDGFTKSYALRLNDKYPFETKEAEDGDEILPGRILISPGHSHCSIIKKNGKIWAKLIDGPPVNRHKPSVAVLFNSVANHTAKKTIGVMLTGMGNDGALAMKEMKEAGSYNITQDEATSVVYGMPCKAVEYGASDISLPIHQIAAHILKKLEKNNDHH